MKFVILFACVAVSFTAAAQRMDDAAINAEAAKKTQELLKDPKARSEALKANSKTQQAGQAASQVVGQDAQDNEDFYALAAEVFGAFAAKYNGDSQKMMADIEKFRHDPEGFAASWPPEQRAKLKALADKISRVPTASGR